MSEEKKGKKEKARARNSGNNSQPDSQKDEGQVKPGETVWSYSSSGWELKINPKDGRVRL